MHEVEGRATYLTAENMKLKISFDKGRLIEVENITYVIVENIILTSLCVEYEAYSTTICTKCFENALV